MTGKFDVLLDILTANDDSIVVISTHHGADHIRSSLLEYRSDVRAEAIHIVDCVSKMQQADIDADARTTLIASPENLTRIGVAFTEYYSKLEAEPVRVGFHSISHLLMYSELKAVYKFLQVMTGQIKNAGWISAMVYDPSMHDTKESHTIQDPFDGLIETRERDGHRELRLKGLEPDPSKWVRF